MIGWRASALLFRKGNMEEIKIKMGSLQEQSEIVEKIERGETVESLASVYSKQRFFLPKQLIDEIMQLGRESEYSFNEFINRAIESIPAGETFGRGWVDFKLTAENSEKLQRLAVESERIVKNSVVTSTPQNIFEAILHRVAGESKANERTEVKNE